VANYLPLVWGLHPEVVPDVDANMALVDGLHTICA
jgi:hypothetical protein